ncbi:nucleotidyltransferase domain-containing protein [uncultured Parabacteroides sp.]|uniref:nucleotidyltransferase family protein n=1 Tax=uncultured Parabacteroides sp. TaxID=512312 RepID=UPI00280559CF|nr:nucleotidyltransferase domain-containing protein [uncultured Parabacteroides sp.]
MKTTAEIIEILKDYKVRSAEKYGIETLGLFGSVARGEQNEKSDIDVCIRLKKPDFFVRMAIKEELEHLFRKKIDLVPIFETMRTLLRNNIEEDAIYV